MKECRPTTGKVLSALFSILGELRDRRFLDLFSGTGRISLEALARGAPETAAVESDRKRAEAIRALIAPRGGEVFALDVRRALPLLARRGRRFELIFADPPYELGWGRSLVPLLEGADLLSGSGMFVLEHSRREPLEGWNPLIWEEPRVRDYGDTALTFLPRRPLGEGMS